MKLSEIVVHMTGLFMSVYRVTLNLCYSILTSRDLELYILRRFKINCYAHAHLVNSISCPPTFSLVWCKNSELRLYYRPVWSAFMCMITAGLTSVYGARALLRTIGGRARRLVNTSSSSGDMSASSSKNQKIKSSSIANCHLQVLGTGGGELQPSLFLFTDSKRYLFNCVENVQRFCNEYRVRQSKLSNFFITRMTWDNVGGLPGQLLQFANFFDVDKLNPIRLHGPESLADFVYCSRFHVNSGKIVLETGDRVEEIAGHRLPVYRDENIAVHTLNISASPPSSPLSSETESDNDDGALAPRPPKIPKISSPRNSISVFLCKLADVPGKFNPQKATELGLPKGPSYRALVNGQSVTAPNGTVIHPSDVLGPTRIGPTFIVLECPHQRYVQSLTSHPMLQKERFDSSGECVSLIAHMTPRSVLEREEYCQWMASFGPATKHLLLHRTLCPHDWTLRGLLKTHGPLNLLDPSLFREYSQCSAEDKVPSTDDLKILKFLPRESVIVGRTLLEYHLKPVQREGVDESHVLKPFASYWEEHMSHVRSSPEIKKAVGKLSDARKVSSAAAVPPAPEGSGDCVTFLGTGASCPSKYRNVSSILLQTSASGNVLFDSGEGTLAQLYRHFGSSEGDRVLAGLQTIFISHIHGDHNLGIVSLLLRRAEILRQHGKPLSTDETMQTPTRVVGPRKVGWWLKDYSRRCENLYYNFIDSSTLTKGGSLHPEMTLQTVPVIHCPESYGVVVSQGKNWRVVYSGDTRPCPALVEAGKNATLLLHEATLEDGMVCEAEEKRHCTVSEALQVAERMNPDFTILTHFSQRYSKFLPLILGKKTKLRSSVFPAFDHMTVALSDVHRLPTLLPAVQDILACTKDDDDIPLSWGW